MKDSSSLVYIDLVYLTHRIDMSKIDVIHPSISNFLSRRLGVPAISRMVTEQISQSDVQVKQSILSS
jgi:hypothetical protein